MDVCEEELIEDEKRLDELGKFLIELAKRLSSHSQEEH